MIESSPVDQNGSIEPPHTQQRTSLMAIWHVGEPTVTSQAPPRRGRLVADRSGVEGALSSRGRAACIQAASAQLPPKPWGACKPAFQPT